MKNIDKIRSLSNKAIKVSELNNYIKKMFTHDYFLRQILVKGEVSNLKYHSSGHIYFSLKDETGLLSCVMFAGSRNGLSFRLNDGQQVICNGSVDIYEATGKYQLYVKEIILDGSGDLYQKFTELKNKLQDMGMFAPEYKKPIPFFCETVGIVTSPTGAAIQDIQSVAYSRNPFVQLILYPALVQGEGAADSIAEGIKALNKLNTDVIIVGRGGGSIEDLWAFNEETVANAVFASEVPVISAVGHETDFTICDFVADIRVPTPTAAAQLAVFDIRNLLNELSAKKDNLNNLLLNKIDALKQKILFNEKHLTLLNPESIIRNKRENLVFSYNKMNEYMINILDSKRNLLYDQTINIKKFYEKIYVNKKHELSLLFTRLRSDSPIQRLEQGFSYACDTHGNTIKSINDIDIKDEMNIYVSDGMITAAVKEKRREEYV